MAYSVVLNSIAEVTLTYLESNQVLMNLFHYRFTAGPTITDGRAALQDLMDALQAPGQLAPLYAFCLSENIDPVSILAQWITPTRYARKESINTVGPGLVPENAVSPNLAVSITKRGDLANRHSVGTTHMGGVPLTFQDLGMVTPAGFLAYNAFRLSISASVTTAAGRTYEPVIFNRLVPATSVVIETTTVQPQTRVMRRRTVGLGI